MKLQAIVKSITLLAVAAILAAATGPALAATRGYTEEDISFTSGDLTLNGTLLVPDSPGPHPAIVLVHGAGLGRRSDYRQAAEAIVGAGHAALIYDKRTVGYSASGIGSRSYDLLADDALAAVRWLRTRPDVQADNIGLWGLSEGGGVAAIAAARSDDIAFVITIGFAGMPPVQQSAWATENRLRHHGVTSSGAITALVNRVYAFAVSAEMFPEALHDPIVAVRHLQQPLLAIWGALDRTAAPAESARLMQAALDEGGHRQYTVRFIDGADHDAYITSDGYTNTGQLAPEAATAMSAWLARVTAGEPPGMQADAFPDQERPTPDVTAPSGLARWEWQTGFLVLFLFTFGGYIVVGVPRWLRMLTRQHRSSGHHGESVPRRVRMYARGIAGIGLLAVLGVYYMMGSIMMSSGNSVGVVIAGRPAAWLALQAAAVAVAAVAVTLATTWWRQRSNYPRRERSRLLRVLIGAAGFIPWAAWWQLFSL